MRRNQNFEIFWMRKRPTSLRFSFFFHFFAFPFSPFLIFLLQWLTFYWAWFQFKKFWEIIIKTGNFYHAVTTCSRRKLCSEFVTQISEHFCAYFRLKLSQSLWSGYHWKDLFLLQKLSIDDVNFGQRWWCQKWNKGQGLSQLVTGGTGVNGLRLDHLRTRCCNKSS